MDAQKEKLRQKEKEVEEAYDPNRAGEVKKLLGLTDEEYCMLDGWCYEFGRYVGADDDEDDTGLNLHASLAPKLGLRIGDLGVDI